MVIEQIVKYQQDRLLDKQKYDSMNEVTNIIEELMEGLGYNIPKEKRQKLRTMVAVMVTEIAVELDLTAHNPKPEDIVDSWNDVIVFSVGAILKLGYNPTCTLEETVREISSRTGTIVDGKFQKYLSPEAKAKWVIADYSKCEIKETEESNQEKVEQSDSQFVKHITKKFNEVN